MSIRKILSLFILLFWCLIIIGQTDSNRLAITNATFLDVEKGKWIGDVNILVDGDSIQYIGKKIEIDALTNIYDAEGQFIIPGMIDAHIHFFQSGGLYTRPDFIDLTAIRPYEDERAWLMENYLDLSMRYLRMGITSVVDVGGPLTNYAIRAHAEAVEFFPNVYATGPLISTCQPEAFNIDDPPIIKVTTEEEAREEVRKQLPYKPDFIKIWYIQLKSLPADSTYPIIKAAIDESHKHGLKVAVHATQLNTAKLAVKAGADFLVHSVDDVEVDKEFIKMLKKNNVVLCPTLMVFEQYYESLSGKNEFTDIDFKYANPFVTGTLLDYAELEEYHTEFQELASRLEKRLEHMAIAMDNLEKLVKAGITIATGTDAGNIGTQHATSYFEELSWMKQAGLSNMQILRASTYDAAKAIGKESEIGSIAVGKQADLIFLDQNPLDTLVHPDFIRMVMKNAVLYQAESVWPDTPEMTAQRQLNAYNARNVSAFVDPYAEDVEILEFPNRLLLKGADAMKVRYTKLFQRSPNLHCKLTDRIVMGNTVIDKEFVTGMGPEPIEAIAIYTIINGKIKRVYFINE